MATTYPTTKQEFTDPTSTNKQNNPSHSTLHSNLADTVEVIEDKLGNTGSLISGCGGLYPETNSATALKLCQADGTTPVITIDTSDKNVIVNGRIKLAEVGSQDIFSWEGSLADDDFVDLPNNISGFVFSTFDNGSEWTFGNITNASVVTLIMRSSSNVANTDADGKYCIFDNGTNVRVRNRIGTSKNVKVISFIS